jgi:hypothetical protein
MKRDDVVKIIKARVMRPNDATLADKIITEMQFVQEQVLENDVILPWFLLSEWLEIKTRANESRLPLPTNFLTEYEQGSFWVFSEADSRWINLPKGDNETLGQTYAASAPGLPKAYSLDGKYFVLYPTPDKAYRIRQKVYQRDAKLDTNIENNWLLYAGELMVAEVGKVIARNYLFNEALALSFEREAEKARTKVFANQEARLHANQEYSMGD